MNYFDYACDISDSLMPEGGIQICILQEKWHFWFLLSFLRFQYSVDDHRIHLVRAVSKDFREISKGFLSIGNFRTWNLKPGFLTTRQDKRHQNIKIVIFSLPPSPTINEKPSWACLFWFQRRKTRDRWRDIGRVSFLFRPILWCFRGDISINYFQPYCFFFVQSPNPAGGWS